VEQRVSAHLWRAARDVVDVVVLERDKVLRAQEEDVPVLVAVAVGRPRSRSVNVAVGDGHTAAGFGTKDDMLPSDERGRDVIDPDCDLC
jgi:hypothetical protein